MISDPVFTLLYMANMQFVFLFLKRFMDIRFVKTVRHMSF